MTEQPQLLSPQETPVSMAQATSPPQPNRVAWLSAAGFVILAAGLYYVWANPRVPVELQAVVTAIRNLDQHLADTDARLGRLEQRPAPDLGKIASRIDSLESRLVDQTQLGSRLDAISGRLESLSARDQTAVDAAKQRTDGLTSRLNGIEPRISGLETAAGTIDGLSKRLNRLGRLQQASFALASGQPVGDIAGAPDAIARYAHAAPPTEAALKLSFPEAEQAALAATPLELKDAPFADRIWDRAQTLVTIRRGDEIVIGTSSSTILSRAQTAIEAGDLAGAVQALETLKGPPARAIANWLAEAKALLGARSALAAMAGQA